MANDGGPAFPVPEENYISDGTYTNPGMSLRDWFAHRAPIDPLTVAKDARKLMGADVTEDMIFQEVARLSFKYADAMLKEREKNG